MLDGPPTLAVGGGAEVFPAGIFNDPGTMAASWLSNNGFSTKPFEESFASSSSSYRPYASEENIQDDEPLYSSASFDYPDNNNHASSSNSSSDGMRTEFSEQSFANAIKSPGAGSLPHNMSFSARDLLSLTSSARLNAPSSLGLPVYSASGFDLLSVLARVASRPRPQIVLGPVDLTCSFVVVDVRRYDRPIVYASPSFCQLTGYAEHEVIGKNCRFLQAPGGNVKRGDERRFVAPDTVRHLYKSVIADKECQASIINYRKNGQAFINLVTVIPILGGVLNRPEEADEVVYQVGFQVDLTEQPNAILQKLRDGSYIVNYSTGTATATPSLAMPLRDRRFSSHSSNAVSKDLRALLAEPSFLKSIPLSKSTIASSTADKGDSPPEGNKMLNLLLLESTPDFIHVLSLKGSFLYVAPSVRRVLGFEPEELVGKSISDYCHPADLVPLMRELKESSVVSGVGHDGQGSPVMQAGPLKTVDLLFRVQSKSNGYVWVECRGRLHVEAGKGRKAIILSGRTRNMPNIDWGAVGHAGGLTPSVHDHDMRTSDGTHVDREREFWGMVSVQGTFLVVGAGIRDMLGWGAGEVIGKSILRFVVEENGRQVLEEQLTHMQERVDPVGIMCEMGDKEGRSSPVQVVLYRGREQGSTRSPFPVICQIKALDSSPSVTTQHFTRSYQMNVFEELETSRGSSWQYELQQLKFANQRLMEEVNMLESSLLIHDDQRTAPPQFTTASFPDEPSYISRHGWASPEMCAYEPPRSLKRTRDSDAGPSS
ncbi:hypothetical protein PILCRDRAFT_57985 [Piloderma croceum F 1598]|uniref:PAS domain-containing protein n=1 Tax=Piloderma croceum (strain F 1598) TaxID=765440 RepID=A0A0C3GJD0_PILCF|nr:hypothetical protein PILCRDRAFT_57985 [Piloderma croceum F 1598]